MRREARHVGHLLGRLQLPPDRRPAAAGPRRDHDPLLDGRPLRRRRALPGRLRARARHAPLGFVDAGVERAAARPAALRRRLAGGVAAAARLDLDLDRSLARPSAARRVLAARLRLRGLHRDRMPRVRRRGLRRRVHERGPAAPRGALGAAQGPDRALGPRVPRRRLARPLDRLPAGVRPLVRSLAEGDRHGPDGRADAARLVAGLRRAATELRGAGGALGGGADLAVPRIGSRVWELPLVGPRELLGVQSCGTEAGAWTAEGQSADLAGDQRPDDAVSLYVRLRPSDGAARASRAAGGDSGAGRRPAERARRRAPLRRGP